MKDHGLELGTTGKVIEKWQILSILAIDRFAAVQAITQVRTLATRVPALAEAALQTVAWQATSKYNPYRNGASGSMRKGWF